MSEAATLHLLSHLPAAPCHFAGLLLGALWLLPMCLRGTLSGLGTAHPGECSHEGTGWAHAPRGACGQPHGQVLRPGRRQARPPYPVFMQLILLKNLYAGVLICSWLIPSSLVWAHRPAYRSFSMLIMSASGGSSFPGQPAAMCEFDSLSPPPRHRQICHQDGPKDDTLGTRDLQEGLS